MSPSTGNLNLPSTKAVISAAATVATTTMIIRSFTRDFIPSELRHYFFTKLYRFLSTFTTDTTLIIDEFDGLNKNHLFFASELYLTTVITPHAKTFRATLADTESSINVALAGNEEVIDKFRGVAMKWRLLSEKARVMQRYGPYPEDSAYRSEVKCLKLTFHRSYKTMVIEEYLPYVLERSKAVKEERKTLKLHTLKNERMHGIRGSPWQPVNLDHPANFETLAMDGDDKKMIVDDLDRFVRRREFYRKVGKAWKRGYLLFGPPGTGKSSLIAAMANYLNFDVYDLELTDIRCNSDLRRLLIATANRSILVVEDIDASLDLSERKAAAPKPPPGMYPYQYSQGSQITLSGLLNFIDGLWSSCGDERIIIFTTNHKDKIDPALLRPGRMDVHIHMSFCTPCGFKMLLNNYLGITGHPLLSEAEELIAWTKVTPAEVGEQLLKTDDPGLALQGLINFLEQKKESEKAKKENLEVTEQEVELKEEKKEEGSKKMKSVFKGTDGLKELTKLSKASPELRHKILEKDDVAKALKTLVKFLEGENGTEDAKDSGASLGSSVDAQQESGKEHGIKIE